jgi:hypothetical protein
LSSGAGAALTVGTVTINNPGTEGIVVTGTNGPLVFGEVTITGTGAGTP